MNRQTDEEIGKEYTDRRIDIYIDKKDSQERHTRDTDYERQTRETDKRYIQERQTRKTGKKGRLERQTRET